MTNELKVTSLADLIKYKDGQVVELPPFGEGQPFVARLCRPSLMSLVKSGKIPNSLMKQATTLFAKGGQSLTGMNGNTLGEMLDIMDVIVEAAMIEPTYSELKENDIKLSDDQIMAIFTYTQQGVDYVKRFRTEREDTEHNSNE
jgi:hypothetical protein